MSHIARRTALLEGFVKHLESVPDALALYQCGAAAFDRIDEWSDIDFIVLAADHATQNIFASLDRYVNSHHQIRAVLGAKETSWPGVWQKTYSLENESPFHMIEVAVVERSSSILFTEKEIHGNIVVHFDRDGITKPDPVDLEGLASKLSERLKAISSRYQVYHVLPKKEIKRGNAVEAFAFYYQYTLTPYLELLRILYDPFRYSFGARYVYYDLPEQVAKELESCYFIKDLDALSEAVENVQAKTGNLLRQLDSLDMIQHLQRHRQG